MKFANLRKATTGFICGTAIFTLAACGASADPETTDASAAGSPETGKVGSAHDTLLASINVSYGKIAFHKLENRDGLWRIAISEVASSRIKTSPFKKFLNDNKLTSLEVFQAVAPNKQAPQEMFDVHPVEASRLGRKDAALQRAVFDANAPVEKSLSECTALYGDGMPPDCTTYWGNVQGMTNPTAGDWLPVGTSATDWDHNTMNAVAMIACNESDDVEDVILASSINYWDWDYWYPEAVPAHSYLSWWMNESFYGPPNICPEPSPFNPNPICSDTAYPARYAIWGQGTQTYHITTGETLFSHCIPVIN